MKKNIRLIIAVISGIIAVFLVVSYIKQQEQKIFKAASQAVTARRQEASKVLVARKNIPEGTVLSEKDLALKEVPQDYIQPRAATSIDRVLGRITNSPIEEGEQILMTKLAVPESATSLANKTPPGKRAITIPIDNITGLSGMIRPGDHVDIMTTMAVPSQDAQGKIVQQPMVLPLFQNVLILAVGSDIGGGVSKEGQRAGANTITFALMPQEATLLAYVQEQAKLRLILRSPTDTAAQTLPPANPQTLFQYISSQLPAQPEEKPKEVVKEKEPSRVEIYRGRQKEVITLGE